MMYKNYTVSAETLMPVHIGGGDEYNLDPIEYTVKNDRFYRIDMGEMFSENPAFAKEFVKESEKSFSILRMRKLINEAFDPEKTHCWLFRSEASPQFKKEFNDKLSDIKNQLIVQTMMHNKNCPLIPGSSIKGSFRTALLDKRANKKGQNNIASSIEIIPDKFKASVAEGETLDAVSINKKGKKDFDIQADPFKGVKITDAILPEDSTEIVCVRNVSINEDKSKGIPMWVEVVRQGVHFTFEISFLEALNFPKEKLGIKSELITARELTEASFEYFQEALYEECEKFYDKLNITPAVEIVDKIEKISKGAENAEDLQTFIRLGRFSHLESMTFSRELRQPKHEKGYGKTRNLVNGEMPLGFLKLDFYE